MQSFLLGHIQVSISITAQIVMHEQMECHSKMLIHWYLCAACNFYVVGVFFPETLYLNFLTYIVHIILVIKSIYH